jgi:hypothetical protein
MKYLERLVVVAMLVAATAVRATTKPHKKPAPPKQPWTYATLVPACRDWARRFEPGFDAYWNSADPLPIRTWGVVNGVGDYQFTKCMAGNGLPVVDAPAASVTTTTTLPPRVVWRIAWRHKPGEADREWKYVSDGPFESRYACEGYLLRKFSENGYSPDETRSALNDWQCFSSTGE